MPARTECTSFEGTKLETSFFQFSVTYAAVVPTEMLEMSDSQLLRAAEKSGTFSFLDAPGEDIYDDLAKRRE